MAVAFTLNSIDVLVSGLNFSESSSFRIDSINENSREVQLNLEVSQSFNKFCNIAKLCTLNTGMSYDVPQLDMKNLLIIPNFNGNPDKLH